LPPEKRCPFVMSQFSDRPVKVYGYLTISTYDN
jgi:hypothetical protein